MKIILNPRLMKDKITEIEDSSSQEDVEKKKSLNPQQAHTRKHHSVMLESSTSKKKIAEQSMDCSTEGVVFPEIPVVSEVFKHE